MTLSWKVRYYLLLWGLLAWALVAWHLAVCLTAGGRWTDPKAGIAALKVTAHLGTAVAGVRAATTATLVVWLVLVLVVVVLEEVWALSRRRRRRAAATGELASGRALRRAMRPTRKVDVVPPFAFVDGVPLRLRTEDNGAVVAPPRIGKTMYVAVPKVVDSPGAVVATSTKPDVLRLTAGIRAKVGRVFVFDPEGVSLWPDPIRWDMVAGCSDPAEASERADALVGSRDLGDARNAQFFQEAAATVLRCLLLAAASKPGGSMRDVVRWARDFADDEPYELLRRPSAPGGWVRDLAKFCRGAAHETVSSTDMSLGLVLKAFALPAMLEAVCPYPGTGFDPSRFHETRDTLYLLSRSGSFSACAPIFAGLVTAIERRARLDAGHTAAGHIEPPLTLVLDEVANIVPIRDLDSLMADGGGRGVICWPFVQSREQLAKRYGRETARTILDSASVFCMLAGSKDVEHLRELSALSGEQEVERFSHSQQLGGQTGAASIQRSYEHRALLPIETIRTIGDGRALILYRAAAPAIATLVPWWERKDRADFEASAKWVLSREGLDPAGISAATVQAEVRAAALEDEQERAALA